jgi:SAM-dependent methyltransferase
VELCLQECTGGERVLEVGFGAGMAFPVLGEIYRHVHGLEAAARFDVVRSASIALRERLRLLKASLLATPYAAGSFDTVLLISVLEHLRPGELERACSEICRILRPGGQLVYGVPVDRPLMATAFALLGYNIRRHHFSDQEAVSASAGRGLRRVRLIPLFAPLPGLGPIYEVGHFVKAREVGGPS